MSTDCDNISENLHGKLEYDLTLKKKQLRIGQNLRTLKAFSHQ